MLLDCGFRKDFNNIQGDEIAYFFIEIKFY
jgi:hypothetical protein